MSPPSDPLQAAFFHQLLDLGDLHRHERRPVLVARSGADDSILEAHAEPELGNLHRGLNREHLTRLQRLARSADIVDLDADRMSEAARFTGAIPIHEGPG